MIQGYPKLPLFMREKKPTILVFLLKISTILGVFCTRMRRLLTIMLHWVMTIKSIWIPTFMLILVHISNLCFTPNLFLVYFFYKYKFLIHFFGFFLSYNWYESIYKGNEEFLHEDWLFILDSFLLYLFLGWE